MSRRSAKNAPLTTINVLANDSDPDGGPKLVASVTPPAHGTAAIGGGGRALQAGHGLLQRPGLGARHLHLQAERRLERDRLGHRPVHCHRAADGYRPEPSAPATTAAPTDAAAHLQRARHDGVHRRDAG